MATIRVTKHLKPLQAVTLLKLPSDTILHLIPESSTLYLMQPAPLQVVLIGILIDRGIIRQKQVILWLHLGLQEICECPHCLLEVERIVVLLSSLILYPFFFLLFFARRR